MTAPLWLTQANAIQANEMLLERYLDVLNPEELAVIGETETEGNLSGLFLPKVAEAYLRSPFRVMVIGQEPRGWNGHLRELRTSISAGHTMRDYVQKSMETHLKHSQTLPRLSKFMQFYEELRKYLGDHVSPQRNAVFWGNVLCVSLDKRSAAKAIHIDRLQEISQELLTIQFEVLRPHVVVFASGWRYDQYIRPAIEPYETHLEKFIPKKFWPFTKQGQFQFEAFRVPHPRAHTAEIRSMVLQAVKLRLNYLTDVC